MTIKTSGKLSLKEIAQELGVSASSTLAYMNSKATNNYSAKQVNHTPPHTIKEFYGYNHHATAPLPDTEVTKIEKRVLNRDDGEFRVYFNGPPDKHVLAIRTLLIDLNTNQTLKVSQSDITLSGTNTAITVGYPTNLRSAWPFVPYHIKVIVNMSLQQTYFQFASYSQEFRGYDIPTTTDDRTT